MRDFDTELPKEQSESSFKLGKHVFFLDDFDITKRKERGILNEALEANSMCH